MTVKLIFGEEVTPGPLPPNDENNVYGVGFRASRTEGGGYVLSWDAGELASRDVEAPITAEEFETLRADSSAFAAIARERYPEATDVK